MIVEAFDPVNDVESSLGTGFVSQLIKALDLHRLEEAFHRRIIPTICSATHRLQHPEIGDQPAVTIARVLGEFNRSSQHFLMGGDDGHEAAAIAPDRTCEDEVTRAATCFASIGATAIVEGDRRWLLE